MMTASTELARMASAAGYDYVGIDLQHGFARIGDVVPLSDAIRSGGGAMVVARVAENDFTQIGAVADSGVEAVIVPLVSSAADAERAVASLRYPDVGGRRSWGAANALMTGDPTGGDTRPLLFAMIETAEGLSAVDQIAAVDGVDGLYVGPSDLAFAVGSQPGPEGPRTTEAIALVLDTARRHRRIPAIHAGDGVTARQRRDQGFTFVTASLDVGATRRAFVADLAQGRSAE
ncbi:HpcH/HpaI aldolase family protein [Microbacterium resistens]|uniref:HpcH/HpaI aldolase family protein n=2 Tax=Microbacterium resistens TaxID=156977 RepID=UPI0020D05B94|nr:aldolase/citrate lyase family protein [Microbacterium resistens]